MCEMLEFEQTYWNKNPFMRLAGVDEAGRGPLVGAVFASAVEISAADAELFSETILFGLTDSKKLSAKRREHYFGIILHTPEIHVGVGMASVAEIDRLNILQATHLAMRRAVLALPTPDAVLVDGLPVKGLPCPSQSIVKGDAKSLLIAAASVVAKVSRDSTMAELDTLYPGYNFATHKGYGTKAHLEALHRLGPTPEHRKSFAPVANYSMPLFNT